MTFDQVVICLEEQLEKSNGKKTISEKLKTYMPSSSQTSSNPEDERGTRLPLSPNQALRHQLMKIQPASPSPQSSSPLPVQPVRKADYLVTICPRKGMMKNTSSKSANVQFATSPS